MKLTEATIEEVLQELEQGPLTPEFSLAQLEFWQYLNSETFLGLKAAEHQLLFFVLSVIYHSYSRVIELPDFDIDLFQKSEDDLWAQREGYKSWPIALDNFFESSTEEDIMAFVEDMITEEEPEELTELGKEVVFITAFAYILFLSSG